LWGGGGVGGGGGVRVVHNFGICISDMKSKTMLCNFYKKLSIPVFREENNRNKRTISSGYFKNLKELVGFS